MMKNAVMLLVGCAASVFSILPVMAPVPARAEIISCANRDLPVPLESKVPGASITGYRMDREIDTDVYAGCAGSEDSVYILTVQMRNATQAQLSSLSIECKVYSRTGLLMDRLTFDMHFATKLDPGDSGRTNASAKSTHATGERLDCLLNSAT